MLTTHVTVHQVVLAMLVAVVAAAPNHNGRKHEPIRLLKYYFNQDGRGNYEYGYEQDNGQKVRTTRTRVINF